MRFAVVVLVAATGCGRIGFEIDPAVQVNSEGVPLANLVCAESRTTTGPLLATGEIAATRTGNGLYAAWTGTTSQSASIVKLDAQLGVVARWDLGAVGPNLNGLHDLGTHVLAAYGTNADAIVDMWQFTSDLSIANYFATYAGNPARGPFLPNPTGAAGAYVWSFKNTLIASSMDPMTGYAAQGSMFDMTATITELSGDTGVHDSALVWIEDLGGGVSRCSAGNIGFDTPTLPSLRATRVVSGDCRHARIAAGPSDDTQLVVTSTAGGAVRAHLRRGGDDIVRGLSMSGRAAKVRFDGKRFWLAWLDNGVTNIRIAALDLTGNLVLSTTPGPQVAGDEAFDLVRTSTGALLVVLTPSALELVTFCQ